MHFLRSFFEFLRFSTGRDFESRKQRNRELNELKKQREIDNANTGYELDVMKIKFSEQLIRLQEREVRTTRDYKEFLDMIDEMKLQIVAAYPDMPKVMALVIHQHAKQLIDDMWNNPDEKMQQQCRAKLTQFIKVVSADTAQVITSPNNAKIPAKTLHHIELSEHEK